MIRWTLAGMLVSIAVAGCARPAAQAAIDTSLFVAEGPALRGFTKEVVVAAPPSEVFAAWTTSEGLLALLEVPSHVELRVGGPYELYFMPDTPDGPIGSNGCKVLAYVPDRMLAFSWNAPPKFPAERARHTWVVVTLEPHEAGGTHVALSHLGFGEGGQWEEVQAYFDRAWGAVLGALAAHFSAPPDTP